MKGKPIATKKVKVKSTGGKLQAEGVSGIESLGGVMFGLEDVDAFNTLLGQTVQSMPSIHDKDDAINYVTAMLLEIKPGDACEALLVTQMIAVHAQSMECMRRVALPNQTSEGIDMNVNRATKLQRTFVQLMDSLQKYRNKGRQTIQVQHVNVEAGGQAVVANMGGGEG